jgi:hypothetical protein
MTYLNKIDKTALLDLCVDYDIRYKDYPESHYEGQALYEFFLCQQGEAVIYPSWEARAAKYAERLAAHRKMEESEAEEE